MTPPSLRMRFVIPPRSIPDQGRTAVALLNHGHKLRSAGAEGHDRHVSTHAGSIRRRDGAMSARAGLREAIEAGLPELPQKPAAETFRGTQSGRLAGSLDREGHRIPRHAEDLVELLARLAEHPHAVDVGTA